MGDTLLIANSGGTNVSYVDLNRGTTGREVYRYPLPNLIPCTITTETSQSGFAFQQRVATVSLINLDKLPQDKASFGSTVHLRESTGGDVVYQLVMPEDADLSR